MGRWVCKPILVIGFAWAKPRADHTTWFSPALKTAVKSVLYISFKAILSFGEQVQLTDTKSAFRSSDMDPHHQSLTDCSETLTGK